MKIKLFTHTDLDGIGCYIVAAQIFGKENVSVTYCDYHNVNEKIMKFIENSDGLYDRVFITDISVNSEVALEIDKQNGFFYLLDHHVTAEWLNQFDWARVIPVDENDGCKTSGTSLLAGYLEESGHTIPAGLLRFVEKVRRYDTWEWQTKYDDTEAKQLNDLFSIYGREEFIQDIHDKLVLNFDLIEDTDKRILEIRQKEIDRYIYSKEKGMQVRNIDGYQVGLVFSERFSSEMGNTIAINHPEIDIVAMINIDSGSVSLRTNKDDVDVSEFAKKYGGGGHPKASGMPLDPRLKNLVLALQFPNLLAQ